MKTLLTFVTAILLCSSLLSAESRRIELSLEHAITIDEISWGLMQREDLAPNQGMLFHYPKKQRLVFWSFNCLMDFDVAFLDDEMVIRNQQVLRSYPEMMDPARPVKRLEDMGKYHYHDSVVRFFRKHSIASPMPARYVLEMPKGSFAKLDIRVGDRLVAKPGERRAWIDSTRAQ